MLSRGRFLNLRLVLAVSAAVAALSVPAGASARGDIQKGLGDANVVLIVLNSLPADSVGCYGYERAVTPNLDALAADGVRFTRAYSPSASDFSANASILTGLDPMTTGLFGVFEIGMKLAPEFYTLAEMMTDSGYRTVSFVSTLEASHALQLGQGFEFRNDYFLEHGKLPDVEIDREITQSIFQLRNDKFFAYIHLREPDAPYNPPAPFRGKFTAGQELPFDRTNPLMTSQAFYYEFTEEKAQPYRDAFDENLAYADFRLGRYVKALKEHGLYDKTIIIVTANHGEAFGQHGHIRHDRSVYEEMIRVPLVIRFPGEAAPRGVAYDHVVEHIDLMPTLAEALDISVRDVRRNIRGGYKGKDLSEGESWLPLLWDGRVRNDGIAYAQCFTGERAVIDADWKLIRHEETRKQRLYHLAEDPGETQDVGPRHPEEVERLGELWDLVFNRGAQPIRPETVKELEEWPPPHLDAAR